ncbi:MAG TPA: Zn-dependent hydrolase [Bacteroidales bacterium]|nr:Zn-dependent hydrolase [Bacteroidales bacterium]
MRRKISSIILLVLAIALFASCGNQTKTMETENELQKKVDEFVEVELTTDISHLSDNQKEMLGYLFDAGKLMEDIYWKQAYGNKEELLNSITDPVVKEFVKINFGPWERLNNNKSFVEGIGPKPAGANFYPIDMTKEEFEALESEDKTSLYTIIRRDENGSLYTIPYHEAYKEEVEKAVELIQKAAELADDAGFKKYLELRAKALQTDDYYKSDVAWMEMKSNLIDFVVGPIENYEDALYGYKAANESFILIKDLEWSKKLDKFAALLPQFQKDLPVAAEYKSETPGSDSDLGAYDAVYYAGDCNAGSKTIAINLPNDEQVRLDKGSRKLQLKNSMRAKFDKILVPISNILISEDQRQHVKFDAFFENTMFHEVAHGLGMGSTIDGSQTVREALQNYYSSIEEGKADILGLYIVTKLYEMGELNSGELMDNYVTFMAGIFRSARFGIASSHGKANMMRFYFFEERGAFLRDEATGTFKVDFEKMKTAMDELTEKILIIQGDGNYEAAKAWVESDGMITESLQKDLDRINSAGIPRDIRFKQEKEMLGLN